MKRFIPYLILFTICSLSSTLKAQWTNLNSPPTVSYFAASATGSDLYAHNGVIGSILSFQRRSGSGSWSAITTSLTTWPLGGFYGLWVLNSGTLIGYRLNYSPMKYYIMRSTDKGATWTDVDDAANLQANVAGFEGPSGTFYLYNFAGLANPVKTVDDGLTWSKPSTAITPKCMTYAGTALYAATSDNKLMKSKDGGTSWSSLTSTFNSSKILGGPNGFVYASDYDRSVLYVSKDGGTTWSNTNSPGPFFVDMSNRLFTWSTSYVKVSSDYGSTFTDVSAGLGLSGTTGVRQFFATSDGSAYLQTIAGSSLSMYKYASATGIAQTAADLPYQYTLSQNYPNPFNPTTKIEFHIPSAGVVSLKVFDVFGREVAALVDECMEAGTYQTTFDAHRLSSGIYFYTLHSGNTIQTKKMILTK
ncbi:MAG: T9SS type A sorting domain-containing protein [bacterium]